MSSIMTFAQAIKMATHEAMKDSQDVFCYGLGADDPKRIFGTTEGLKEIFGPRVFDTPTAENGMLGIGVGAAINGMRPLMIHQRLDFFLLAMDQLVNSAAKWHYMFGGQRSVPLTIRLILGRGWGQGPTHSQSLQSWFAHIPGLKVVMPATPQDAANLLYASIFDNNPVVFLEHRWLHNQKGEVVLDKSHKLDGANVIASGDDLTLVSSSYLTVEAIHAVKALQEDGVNVDLIDLRVIKPLDWSAIAKSLQKTGRLLVLDNGSATCSIAHDIVAKASIQHFSNLRCAPRAITAPDVPEPTGYGLTKGFHFGAKEIAEVAWEMVKGQSKKYSALNKLGHHDVPGDWFNGPF